jgi:hypothetical protein
MQLSLKGNKMKQLAIITVMSLIAATQAFSQDRGGFGNRGGNNGWDNSSDSYNGGNYGSPSYGQQKERIQLHLNQHLRGQSIIKLKQELKMQKPHMNIKNLELVAVKIVAKSKMGRGQATLLVGAQSSYSETIGGHPEDFHYEDRYTYQKVRISNPGYDSKGKWQIHLQGNIKVKKVVLIVKKKRSAARMQQVRIQMYDQHLRGMNTLKIKRLLKQQNPRLDLQNVDIKSVTIVAKSQRGRGEATLIVGQSESYPRIISGSPRDFLSNSSYTYSSVMMQNPRYDSMGKVQVALRGNIKVKEIIVKIKKKGGMYDDVYTPRRGGNRRVRVSRI